MSKNYIKMSLFGQDEYSQDSYYEQSLGLNEADRAYECPGPVTSYQMSYRNKVGVQAQAESERWSGTILGKASCERFLKDF